jgi:hypothetical protein
MASYKMFDTAESRADIVDISERLAEHLKENNIENVILLDRSARPAYLGLVKVWRKKFPNKKRPNIYFVNPDGFKTEIHTCTDSEKSEKDVLEEFQKNYPALAGNKGKVLVYDTCIHSGDTVVPVIDTLRANGSQASVVISQKEIYEHYNDSKGKGIEISCLAGKKMRKWCRPFGFDQTVKKGESVTSAASKPLQYKWLGEKYKVELNDGINNRKEILRILKAAGY